MGEEADFDSTKSMASGLPLVAIVIPVYNDEARLKLCLEALQEQTYPFSKFEIAVVDNEPSERVRKVCAGFQNVRYLVEPTRGSYSARNTGLQHVQSAAIVAFTDSDCLPEPGWIKNGVSALESCGNCDLLGGRVDIFVKDEKKPNLAELYESVVAFPQKRYVEQGNWAVTANLFVRSRIFGKVGYFDHTLQSGGDMEWGKRAAALGVKIVYADDVVVRHPARASIAELRSKTRRVAGGSYRRLTRDDPSLYGFTRKLVKDLVIWSPDVREQIVNAKLSTKDMIGVYAAWGYLKFVRFMEFIRMRLVWRGTAVKR